MILVFFFFQPTIPERGLPIARRAKPHTSRKKDTYESCRHASRLQMEAALIAIRHANSGLINTKIKASASPKTIAHNGIRLYSYKGPAPIRSWKDTCELLRDFSRFTPEYAKSIGFSSWTFAVAVHYTHYWEESRLVVCAHKRLKTQIQALFDDLVAENHYNDSDFVLLFKYALLYLLMHYTPSVDELVLVTTVTGFAPVMHKKSDVSDFRLLVESWLDSKESAVLTKEGDALLNEPVEVAFEQSDAGKRKAAEIEEVAKTTVVSTREVDVKIASVMDKTEFLHASVEFLQYIRPVISDAFGTYPSVDDILPFKYPYASTAAPLPPFIRQAYGYAPLTPPANEFRALIETSLVE